MTKGRAATTAITMAAMATSLPSLAAAEPLDLDNPALRTFIKIEKAWVDCVVGRAKETALLEEPIPVLAEAAMGACMEEEGRYIDLFAANEGFTDRIEQVQAEDRQRDSVRRMAYHAIIVARHGG